MVHDVYSYRCMKCTPESFATGSDGTDFSRLLTFLESQCTLLGGGSAGADAGSDKVEAEGIIVSELENQKDSSEMPTVSAIGKGAGSILKPRYILSIIIVALAGVLAVP